MSEQTGLNPTLVRFEYPRLLVKDFEHWSVVLRRHQATIGALVLIAKSDATAWPDIGADAFAELCPITSSVERTLRLAFGYDKINYVMLMMVDPNVHFHVFPRYGRDMTFEGMQFADAGWPKAPDLVAGPTVDDRIADKIVSHLKAAWQDAD
jgi:diadenosine tetraphosphate (Ap4A) HIT family hydrolase